MPTHSVCRIPHSAGVSSPFAVPRGEEEDDEEVRKLSHAPFVVVAEEKGKKGKAEAMVLLAKGFERLEREREKRGKSETCFVSVAAGGEEKDEQTLDFPFPSFIFPAW